MTRATSARVAGVTFLLYIVVGIAQMFVAKGVTAGTGIAARLESIAQHAPQMRVNIVLSLVVGFIAVTLAVALYGITRDEDRELSVLALACRACEALFGAFSAFASLGLLRLAAQHATAPQDSSAFALAAFLLTVKGWIPTVAALFFAVGSTIFSWLMLRGRMIPTALAWLGVIASVLLVVLLPLQLVGLARGTLVQVMWLPMAVFEIPLAIWLLVKGVRAPQHA